MVHTWGSVPRCNLTDPAASCQDKETGADVCCTESCQVVALPETVSTPSVTLVNADDISQGIQVRWLLLAGVLRAAAGAESVLAVEAGRRPPWPIMCGGTQTVTRQLAKPLLRLLLQPSPTRLPCPPRVAALLPQPPPPAPPPGPTPVCAAVNGGGAAHAG